MATNQQLILKEESYLNHTSDIGAGSYYIEKLTDDLAEKLGPLLKKLKTRVVLSLLKIKLYF